MANETLEGPEPSTEVYDKVTEIIDSHVKDAAENE